MHEANRYNYKIEKNIIQQPQHLNSNIRYLSDAFNRT